MKENLHLGRILRFSSYFVSLKGKTFHENILLCFSKNITATLIVSVSPFFVKKKIKVCIIHLQRIMIHFQCTFDSFYYSLSINLLQLCVHFLIYFAVTSVYHMSWYFASVLL